MAFDDLLFLIAIAGLSAYFLHKLYTMDDEPETEEDDMGLYDDAPSEDLLKAKLACLKMAQQNDIAVRTADDVVKDAQKFWDFIATEEDDT